MMIRYDVPIPLLFVSLAAGLAQAPTAQLHGVGLSRLLQCNSNQQTAKRETGKNTPFLALIR